MLLIKSRPSPNYSKRKKEITALVLHCDASADAGDTLTWLQDPKSGVSYHYLVSRHGNIYQLVNDEHKAWHAGISEFEGEKNVNEFSIGCAFSNRNDGEEYTGDAMWAMVELCNELMERHAIPVERITTHATISPGRKTDPAAPFNLAVFKGML